MAKTTNNIDLIEEFFSSNYNLVSRNRKRPSSDKQISNGGDLIADSFSFAMFFNIDRQVFVCFTLFLFPQISQNSQHNGVKPPEMFNFAAAAAAVVANYR